MTDTVTFNPFHGDVLPRGVPTSHLRCFNEDARLPTADLPLPVVTSHPGGTVEKVGEITAVTDTPDWLAVAGTIDLPPGDYPCGVDLDHMKGDPHRGLEKALASGDSDALADFFFGDTPSVEYYFSGRLRRLTVYVGDDADTRPAWPGTHITVTAAFGS